jgi:hypothetical protein
LLERLATRLRLQQLKVQKVSFFFLFFLSFLVTLFRKDVFLTRSRCWRVPATPTWLPFCRCSNLAAKFLLPLLWTRVVWCWQALWKRAIEEGQRPDWEEGAAQTLGKKADKKWKLDDDDLVEEEFRPFNAWKSESVVADDLIDEDDLLKDIAQVEPGSLLLPAVGEGECGPAKKACKNCVCGRAEQEAAGASQSKKLSFAESGALEVDANGRSVIDTARLKAAAGGCGSCSLGDAFRCAGCPSKGLPAYSVGDKIVIDLE